MKKFIFLVITIFLFACNEKKSTDETSSEKANEAIDTSPAETISEATNENVKNPSPDEMNAAMVRFFLDEVYNKGNLNVADSLVAPEYKSHNKLNVVVLGPEGIKNAATAQRKAFSNWKTVCDEVTSENNFVTVRGHDEGDFTGDFGNLKATGNHFYITWMDIFKVENGKLVEGWLETDTEDFLNQLTKDNPEKK